MKLYLTADQIKSLEDGIYDSLMDNPENGMGEMGEARDEAERIVRDWMEGNDIEESELIPPTKTTIADAMNSYFDAKQSTPEKTDRELALEWWGKAENKEWLVATHLPDRPFPGIELLTGREIQNIWAIEKNPPETKGNQSTQQRKEGEGEPEIKAAIKMLNDCRAILLGDSTYYKPPYNENYSRIKELDKVISDLASAPTLKKENEELKAENERLQGMNEELAKSLERALSFFADLNGSEWIPGNDAGSLDMKQRSNALQGILFKLKQKINPNI